MYFFSHRALWRPLATKLVPTISLGLGVTIFMFAVTYVPQAAVLAIFNGPLAVLTTILLVLSESSTIFSMLSKNFLIEDALIDTFDGTLLCRDMTTLVANERQVKSGSDPIAKLGKLVSKPFAKFTPKALIRYLMYLPLNFIPVFGTALFIILQGRKYGSTAHARYFQLKQMKPRERQDFIENRKAAYARSVFTLYPRLPDHTANASTASVCLLSSSSSFPLWASFFPLQTPSAQPCGLLIWSKEDRMARAVLLLVCASKLSWPRRLSSELGHCAVLPFDSPKEC